MIRVHPRHLVPLLTLLCFLTLGGAMVRATASPAPEPNRGRTRGLPAPSPRRGGGDRSSTADAAR